MLMPSTWTARRTRAYTSTFSTSPVSHKTQLARDVLLDLNCGGLLFDRHAAPLPRRYVVNYCSGLYTFFLAPTGRHVWATNSSRICLRKLSSPLSSMALNVTPSMPGAPSFCFAIR